jgi:hypothetical protein
VTTPGTGHGTERLLSYLDGQRRHVLGILEGLDDPALRRPVLPSGWSCLGLVQHLTVDIERFWFRGVVGADPTLIADEGTDIWSVAPDVPAEHVLAAYREEIDHSNAIIRSTPLDAPPALWPVQLFGEWRLDDLGEVLLHVIAETAVHAGHLDVTRELIDGRLWRVLT